MDRAVSIGQLAQMLDCEVWRARRLVDIVTRGTCPRLGLDGYGPRMVLPEVVVQVRVMLKWQAREKAGRK